MALVRVRYQLIEGGQEGGGDPFNVEMLARKALRVLEKRRGVYHTSIGAGIPTLSEILRLKIKCDEERKLLLERSLDIFKRAKENGESVDIATGNFNLALCHRELARKFHEKNPCEREDKRLAREQTLIAERYCNECARISSKLLGKRHPKTIKFIDILEEINKSLVDYDL